MMSTYRLHYFPESGNSYKLALMLTLYNLARWWSIRSRKAPQEALRQAMARRRPPEEESTAPDRPPDPNFNFTDRPPM